MEKRKKKQRERQEEVEISNVTGTPEGKERHVQAMWFLFLPPISVSLKSCESFMIKIFQQSLTILVQPKLYTHISYT